MKIAVIVVFITIPIMIQHELEIDEYAINSRILLFLYCIIVLAVIDSMALIIKIIFLLNAIK
jgi:hypothetical protein